MILLIFNSSGLPLYHKNIVPNQIKIDESQMGLLSGLISAISNISKFIFNEDIAEFKIGRKSEYRVTVIVNENLSLNVSVYFVFLSESSIDLYRMKSLATSIFIQTKQFLIKGEPNSSSIERKIDKIIETTNCYL